MNLSFFIDLKGKWKGKNSLWKTPDDFPEISRSDLTITPILKNNFVRFDYTWTGDQDPQEGSLIIGFENKKILFTALWIDTWHTGEKYMTFQGLVDENGGVSMMSHYSVSKGPDWGWKIVLEKSRGSLRLTMYNINPEGKEHLAVKVSYQKIE